jgi:hypothetical protein
MNGHYSFYIFFIDNITLKIIFVFIPLDPLLPLTFPFFAGFFLLSSFLDHFPLAKFNLLVSHY